VYVVTLPIIVYLVIDAEFVVWMLFGKEYADSATVLRILALGCLIHVIPGPNGITLVAFGKSYTVLTGTLLACLTAVLSYLLFVPYFGAEGAAFGIAAGRLVSNLYVSIVLYKASGIHPFTRPYMKIIFVSIPAGAILYLFILFFASSSWYFHSTVPFLTILLTLVAFYYIRGINKQDIPFIRGIEMRIRRNTRVSDWLYNRLQQSGG
jgi:O-antigen/teichoic acid export membrane protein